MEVKEAPPKTAPAEGDGSEDIRALILADCHFKPNTPAAVVLDIISRGFENLNTTLLGAYATRAPCQCGKGCKEATIFGIVLPLTDESLEAIGYFYMAVRGIEIKHTTDPEVARGVFKAYLDVEDCPYPPDAPTN